MSVRRERRPIDRGAGTVRLRLPDGTVKEMPVDKPGGQVPGVCCFCGQSVADDEIRLSAQWMGDGREHAQSWGAHRECLAERIHASVAGTGPFFGD
jgi:hypothetical protein